MPGTTVFDAAMRVLAVVLAFSTAVVLSLLDSTSNDLMAAAPLVWALALAMEPMRNDRADWLTPTLRLRLSGLLAGVVRGIQAQQWSIGRLSAGLVVSRWQQGQGQTEARWRRARLATLVGFALVYGYWGALLWTHFGNPVYPVS